MKVVTISKSTLTIIIPSKIDQFKDGNKLKTILIFQPIMKLNIVVGSWMIR
jgi:hypothetical protein